MKRKIQKVRYSLMARIPKKMAEEKGIDENSYVDFLEPKETKVNDNDIILRKITD